ncbi:MAG TPA: iron dependent repressor, metal binding and dimerization domain protein [Thermoanaerobaculia bacterium]|nr:iron dependent repressor, metal binding and dimerization domain protein [Thermoanaerobaculia bacterium]
MLADLWRLLAEDNAGVSVARRGVADLLADGLLAFVDGKIAFTERGRMLAASAVRRVRLSEVLLARTLSATEECGHALPVAGGFEDQVCAFLDHPTQCPHGRPIPPGGSCCGVPEP